ncbi:UDP-N-acetylmuramoyl-tripeptide--D-alanyl-D-alanine ligase [Thiosulfatimonas sediminis]|uniref:UDP-N-acetylmuramoyl-tripeptide--D-alanyl-D-alanine ligase n=1 Tax=Thiosulfatimonas sediminis TaxID=2675054 RepID=A0A6F8PWT7_9GAMM|nr:UDP-N-acetylmuramoyl-tripeptide--D-alanyl-D-alanine ligase [Thiosulfatimonas sediminis]BBP46556.1 UDP-N-acetylmuramoyl-tripeptide--D-alanyl-D-alanine ligase [Thiosulfatimonas sediminis]
MQTFYWTEQQLVQAVNGEQLNPEVGARTFDKVSTDSRQVDAQTLFIALRGENFDAHQFLAQVVTAGAAVLLIAERSAWEALSVRLPLAQQPAVILVADTRLALADFARWHRRQMPLKKLIAVTGSNGKTTTKTLLAQVFARAGKTLATVGNLNNDFGVPRTLLCLRPDDEYAIIEMGANHRGEIRYLTQIAEPDITVITNVAGAHLEGFGSLQGVIETKGEIIEGLKPESGVAIFNADMPGLDFWLEKAQTLGIEQVKLFAIEQLSVPYPALPRVTYSAVHTQNAAIQFELQAEQQAAVSVQMPVLGEHNAMNAAAVCQVALSAGLAMPQILAALQAFSGVPGRLQQTQIDCGLLLDDSYNANPESVKAGLASLAALPGCSIACLGAMAELGEYSAAGHREVAEFAAKIGIDALLVYGEAAQPMAPIFLQALEANGCLDGQQSAAFSEHAALNEHLTHLLAQWMQQRGTPINILVKGSRSSRMEQVVQFLSARHHG